MYIRRDNRQEIYIFASFFCFISSNREFFSKEMDKRERDIFTHRFIWPCVYKNLLSDRNAKGDVKMWAKPRGVLYYENSEFSD